MSNSTTNSIPEFVDLALRVLPPDQHVVGRDVVVELRVARLEIDADENDYFRVSVKRLALNLDLQGFDITPGTRFGEPDKANEIKVESRTTAKSERNFELSGHADAGLAYEGVPLPTASAGGKASASRNVQVTSETTTVESSVRLRVKARPNMTWEITDLDINNGKPKALDDTFLKNEKLCQINPVLGANRKTVDLHAIARQRDIDVEAVKNRKIVLWKSRNHERLFNVFMTKALNGGAKKYTGLITFSICEVDIEE